MTTSDQPTREEIYWGRVYRLWMNRFETTEMYCGATIDDTTKDNLSRKEADKALAKAKQRGYPKGF